MPIYEYKCENGHVFDVMQKLSDDPVTTCTVCGAPVRKVLHPVGISFKGSGFYATDYKGAASKAETTKNGESDEKAASSDKGAQKSSPTTEKAASKQD